jgi:hypothetical protein
MGIPSTKIAERVFEEGNLVSTSEHAPPGIALAADRTVCVIRPEADRQPLAAVRLVHIGRPEARAPPRQMSSRWVQPPARLTTHNLSRSTERGTVEVTHCNSSISKMLELTSRSRRQAGSGCDP